MAVISQLNQDTIDINCRKKKIDQENYTLGESTSERKEIPKLSIKKIIKKLTAWRFKL